MGWTERFEGGAEGTWVHRKSIGDRIRLMAKQDPDYELQYIWAVYIETGEIGRFTPQAVGGTYDLETSMAVAEHVALETLKSMEAAEHELMSYRENNYVQMEPRREN